MAVWDPFSEFEALRREIDRASRQYPLVNLHDDGTNLYVEALAPGVEPDKFEVTAVGNTLTIAGEKPGLKDVPQERLHRSERAAGRFVRTVELPADIDPDKIHAQYRHGLLLLTLPRAESARPRRIAVQAN